MISFNNKYLRLLTFTIAILLAFGMGVWSVGALNLAQQPSAVSFGTGFSYQGFLRDDHGAPLTDTCDFTFQLYDDATSGSQIGVDNVINGVTVTDGLFNVVVNAGDEFGTAGMNGGGRFLDITVQCSGDVTSTTLAPRQPLNPVPYARFAERFAGYENLIIVAKQGGDFESVAAAVEAIGTDSVYPAASSTNRYVIYIAPGIYENESVQMKEYVDIEGAGQGVTVITSNAGAATIEPSAATLVGASNAELRDVTVENIGSTSDWAFAIYTAANTSFNNVTTIATGGSRPRGMMIHDGGFPIMKNVAFIAYGGSHSNIGADIYLASAIGEALFASASGGVFAHGFYINSATDTVKFENVTTFVSDGSTQTNGVYILQSDVSLTTYETVVSSAGELVTGIYCTNPNSRLTGRELTITGTKEGTSGTIRGILASNCDVNILDATAEVSSPSIALGVYFSSTASEDEQLELNQFDIKAHSTANTVNGLYLTSNTTSSATGRLNDITIQASGQITTNNSHGVYHSSLGDIYYQDLAVDLSGRGNFMYGVKAVRGAPEFQNMIIKGIGEAETTVFGVEFLTPVAGGSVENAQIYVENIGDKDAVGLKNNSPESFRFRNISTHAIASNAVWGYDFVGGAVLATDLEAVVEGTANDVYLHGIRCFGSSADIHNAHLTVQASPTVTPTVTYGVIGWDCTLQLSGSQVRTYGENGSRYGLYLYNSATSDPHFVRDSFLRGYTSAIRTSGYANLVVTNSQLEGGATSSGSATDNTVCTAVTFGEDISFEFLTGPDDCP